MAFFPFAQFEAPGGIGIEDGRYLISAAERDHHDVLVLNSLQAPRRRRRRRPRRAREAAEKPGAEPLPATRATIVRADAFESEGEAATWLARMRSDPEARDRFAADARALLNRALHAHRAATMDPYVSELGPDSATATRLGYGNGDELASGKWSEAVEAPPDPGRRERRTDALRPTERLTAVLGGREDVAPYETLVLRARLDLDHGRPREAALELEPAARALIDDLGAGASEADQRKDLDALSGHVADLERARDEAIAGPGRLDESLEGAVTDSLALCERILRRRRILGA